MEVDFPSKPADRVPTAAATHAGRSARSSLPPGGVPAGPATAVRGVPQQSTDGAGAVPTRWQAYDCFN